MELPTELELEPFFLIAHRDTGEIYCAHQEYSVSDRRLLTRAADEDRLIEIALKANPAAEEAKDSLRVVQVTCEPATNFGKHRVDVDTGRLHERKSKKEPDAEALGFEYESGE